MWICMYASCIFHRWDWLEATTGPVMLWGAIQTYKSANDNTTRGLTILPRGAIYPIDWRMTVWGPKDGPGVGAGGLWQACLAAWAPCARTDRSGPAWLASMMARMHGATLVASAVYDRQVTASCLTR